MRAAAVLAPKVGGAWNLHRALADTPLDFFVLFSSAAAVLGSPGQSIYAAANACLDALAAERVFRGLRGISVNWGPWADAGMAAAQQSAHRARWARQGWTLIPPDAGRDLLHRLIGDAGPQRAVLPVDWRQAVGAGPAPPLLREIDVAAPPRNTDAFDLAEALSADGRAREEMVEQYVTRRVTGVLSIAEINPEEAIAQRGLDSLMALELRNAFERDTGVAVKAVTLLDGASVRTLARDIAGQLSLSKAGSEALLARIDELSDHEVAALLASLDAQSGTKVIP